MHFSTVFTVFMLKMMILIVYDRTFYPRWAVWKLIVILHWRIMFCLYWQMDWWLFHREFLRRKLASELRRSIWTHACFDAGFERMERPTVIKEYIVRSLLLAPCSLLLAPCSLLLAPCYLLLATRCLLLATCSLLLATCCLLLVPCSWLVS